ncbi:hypothetical protein FA95DRAFT_1608296 [Auriscalpium vulgare]|uniref:Uncharacterized protein n=1 Tax=Auriscalpium vulgare TaxID=40419 RepID=A0ACB8RKY4_9AGAM|nr:hypothetical protein FA95DRAFT_1608296 [Auriscalpium vulgare]
MEGFIVDVDVGGAPRVGGVGGVDVDVVDVVGSMNVDPPAPQTDQLDCIAVTGHLSFLATEFHRVVRPCIPFYRTPPIPPPILEHDLEALMWLFTYSVTRQVSSPPFDASSGDILARESKDTDQWRDRVPFGVLVHCTIFSGCARIQFTRGG